VGRERAEGRRNEEILGPVDRDSRANFFLSLPFRSFLGRGYG